MSNVNDPQTSRTSEPHQQPQTAEETEEVTSALAKKKHRLGIFRQFITAFSISITFFIMGSSVGWTAPVLYNMKITGVPMNLSTTDASLMVSLYYAGNIIMPIPSGILSDFRGRKSTLLYLLILPLLSWILIYFAKRPVMLHVARILAGMWTGIVITVGPLYLAEVAEPTYRGAISTMLLILANFGSLLMIVVGLKVSYWTMAIFFGVTPILSFAALIFVPESPYWLVYKGQNDKAAKNLAWLRGHKEVEAVQEEMNNLIANKETNLQHRRASRLIFNNKGYRKAFIIVEAISILQRLSGVSAIIAYATVTLPDVSLGLLQFKDSQGVITTVWTVSILITPFLIDRVGRIPLLGFSSIGCAVSNLALCLWFYFHMSTSELVLSWVPFTMYMLFGVSINLGLNPIAATLQGEMFPAHLKGIASGITTMIVAATSFLTCALYLIIAENIGMYFNFLYFTVACVVCAVISWTYVIETKGKTLLEIQQELQGQRLTPKL